MEEERDASRPQSAQNLASPVSSVPQPVQNGAWARILLFLPGMPVTLCEVRVTALRGMRRAKEEIQRHGARHRVRRHAPCHSTP